MNLDIHSYIGLLQSCNARHLINIGKQIHLLFLKLGTLNSTITTANRVLQMYTRCGSIGDARKVFDEMPEKNYFTWNTMIEGFLKYEDKDSALSLFHSMPRKNDFSWTLVVSGFVKLKELNLARRLFDEMPGKNGTAWNSMIHGYARGGNSVKALRLFKELYSKNPLGDSFIFASVVSACADLGSLDCGKQIHARILLEKVEFDSVLGSSLVNFYGKCGDLDSALHVLTVMDNPDDFSLSALIAGYAKKGKIKDARRIFNMQTNPCVALWNSMITGYISNNQEAEGIALFNDMRRNAVCQEASTFGSVLSACSSLRLLQYSRQIHTHVSKAGLVDDIVVVSALIDVYSKCGSSNDACKLFSNIEIKAYDTILLNSMITVYSNCGRIEDAKRIFETMPSKSLISWNSMIVAFSQNGCPVEALAIFCEMNKLNLWMDSFTVVSAISACASVSSLELGEQLFARAIIIGLGNDQIILTSLIDFYGKCGHVKNGRKLFDEMVKFDEVSWNSMLMGYTTNGYGYEALHLFNEMQHAGVCITNVTFTGVLSACAHCGLVEEGRKWFHAMKADFHMEPEIEHYSCMVDLFARAGCLQEAMHLISRMPFEVDANMWSSVLRGCVAHGDKILGKKVAEHVLELDPGNSSAYVQLSTMLASSGDWGISSEIRTLMKEKQIEKPPGFSWGDG